MPMFEAALGLLFAGSLLVLGAGWVGLPYPALLAMAGAVLAFIPGVPFIHLDPPLALALFVAPALLNAAYDTSLRDLRHNWRPVAALSIGLVCATAAVVAAAARAVVPSMPWAVAVALGAIVAPPDAVAATTILRRLDPPYRLQVVLEGESLLNDATALLIWRLALTAAAGGLSWGKAAPEFLMTAVGGVVAGYVLARLYMLLTARVQDVSVAVLLQFLATFAVWLLAEAVGLSAIVTMVVYGITIAQTAPYRQPARSRISSNAVWDVAVLALNILAFILMGLQVRGILQRIDHREAEYALFAGVVCGAVILVRIAWVAGYNAIMRWRSRGLEAKQRRRMLLPTGRTGFVVAWSGMRGVVTLATALAIPLQSAGSAFPYRDLVVFTAFCVVLVTLVLQGLTLPLLVRRLAGDDTVANEIWLARAETARAALAVLEGDSRPETTLRREYRARLRRADAGDASVVPPDLALARQRALAAERETLARLRSEERIGDAAFHRVEEELDWAEVDTEARIEES